MSSVKLIHGDCLDKLKELEDNSVDSIVTDPPYGLSAAPNSGKSSKGGFMGKKWDYDVPSIEIWNECMRVLKPGGHLLAFAGSRTYHRMAVRIEDAGFEIRDQIMWLYGSGFPKSHNIGKAVDKLQGNEREYIGEKLTGGIKRVRPDNSGESHPYATGQRYVADTKGNSEWEGWGTALKPAHEPIVMARKPLSEKTVVDNVLKWGTGGINIDESRIGLDEELDKSQLRTINRSEKTENDGWGMNSNGGDVAQVVRPEGRFPANLILDEDAGKMLDEQSGISKSTGGVDDIGGASRFFYCPKTSKTDRNEGVEHLPISRPDTRTETGMGTFTEKGVQPSHNSHPTVKPTDLMLYLIRLVTPKGGIVLDPFMGSGSTGKAAVRGGFNFIGIERETEYFQIAEARINWEMNKPKTKTKSKTKSQIDPDLNEATTKFWE